MALQTEFEFGGEKKEVGYHFMPGRALIITLICLFAVARTVAASLGNVDGVIEWRYGEHQAQEAGDRVLDGKYFSQQYSLFYSQSDLLMSGKLGQYNIGLGYEWNVLDSEVRSTQGGLPGQDVNISTGKVLFEGDLTIAPGGMPFRLNAYSYDLRQTSFSESTVSGLFDALETDSFSAPEFLTGINNGQHITSGVTMFLGVPNGDYEGPYRSLMVNSPRIMIDYKQNYVRDLKSNTPSHYRDRNLAFVSLNKKDNWFHFRFYDHKDFENPGEDFEEKTYLLGTIDHQMQRKWVSLTNWIKVSADASYITTNFRTSSENINRAYDFNFAAIARRGAWTFSTFDNYYREISAQSLQKQVELPFFFKGRLGPEWEMRGRFITARDEESNFIDNDYRNRENFFANWRIQNLPRTPVLYSADFSAERKSGTEGEGLSFRTLFEAQSNRLYRPTYDMYGSYSLAHYSGDGSQGFSVDFWEQEMKGRIETDMGTSWRTGVNQSLLYGTGSLDRTVTDYLSPQSDLGLMFDGERSQTREGSVFHSTTTLFAEHRGSSRFSNRFEFTYDYITDEQGDRDQVGASHRLNYDNRKFRVSWRNAVVIGNHDTRVGPVGRDNFSSGGGAEKSLESRLDVSYFPKSNMELDFRGAYSYRETAEGSSTEWFAHQSATYNLITSSGISRQLVQFREDAEYERISDSFGELVTKATFTLSADYFPTRILFLGSRLRFQYLKPENAKVYTAFLSAGLNFEKLQVAFDYSYGTRDESATVADRQEHRWELRTRKVF